jgi:elongation factor Ts
MEITTDLIKSLRDATGVSVMQCKKALEEAGGDMEKARIILQKLSATAATKKGDRTLAAGTIGVYLHNNHQVGAMVELGCETDFVAKNEEFVVLARDIAMHVSAQNPKYVSMDQVSDEEKATAMEVFQKDIEGKPEEIKAKIMEGKLQSHFGEKVLLSQPFIKNPDVTIQDLIQGAIQKFGEKVEVVRIARLGVQEL